MKKMLSMILTVVMLAMFIPAQAENTGIISGISALDAYEEMLIAFELQAYDEAREFIEKYQLAEKNIKDAALYSNYLQALAYMDTGEYQLAAYLFESLLNDGKAFLDSNVRFQYCTGRYAEDAGDYDLAISSYQQASSFADSSQRMVDCIAKKQQAMIAAAQACYETAVAGRDVEMMETAAQMFIELNDATTAEKIRSEIVTMNHQIAYDNALASYQAAVADADTEKMEEAAQMFIAIGEDLKAEEIRAEIIVVEQLLAYGSALAYYDTAVAAGDTAMMETAARMFEQIGETQMAEQIRAEITEILNKRAYDSALARYEEAAAASDAAELEKLHKEFAALGDYLDSAELAQACLDAAKTLTRTLAWSEPVATQTSLELSWTDTVAGNGYIIRYAPENVPETAEITVTDTQAVLEKLLPGTRYTIKLTAADQPEHTLTITADTLPAAAYTAGGFAVRYARLIGVKSSYLNFYSMAQLLDEKQTALTYFDDYVLAPVNVAPALQPMKYCYVFTYQQSADGAEPVDTLWVLRSESAGTYALEMPDAATLQTSGRLFVELESLFTAVYNGSSEWPKGSLTLELYIDGALAAQGAIILQME